MCIRSKRYAGRVVFGITGACFGEWLKTPFTRPARSFATWSSDNRLSAVLTLARAIIRPAALNGSFRGWPLLELGRWKEERAAGHPIAAKDTLPGETLTADRRTRS